MTRYILLNDLTPVERYLSDFSDIRDAIADQRHQTGLTVLEMDYASGTFRNVTEDVARDWYDNHVEFMAIDDVDGIPGFVRDIIGDEEIQEDRHQFRQGHRAFA